MIGAALRPTPARDSGRDARRRRAGATAAEAGRRATGVGRAGSDAASGPDRVARLGRGATLRVGGAWTAARPQRPRCRSAPTSRATCAEGGPSAPSRTTSRRRRGRARPTGASVGPDVPLGAGRVALRCRSTAPRGSRRSCGPARCAGAEVDDRARRVGSAAATGDRAGAPARRSRVGHGDLGRGRGDDGCAPAAQARRRRRAQAPELRQAPAPARARRPARAPAPAGSSERIDVAVRIGGDADAEMDVGRARDGVLARPDLADDVALRDRAAARDGGRAELEQRDRVAVGGQDRERAAAVGHRADEGDGAGGRRAHRRADRLADVDAAVLAGRRTGPPPRENGRRTGPSAGQAQPAASGDDGSGRDRSNDRDGEHAPHRRTAFVTWRATASTLAGRFSGFSTIPHRECYGKLRESRATTSAAWRRGTPAATSSPTAATASPRPRRPRRAAPRRRGRA